MLKRLYLVRGINNQIGLPAGSRMIIDRTGRREAFFAPGFSRNLRFFASFGSLTPSIQLFFARDERT